MNGYEQRKIAALLEIDTSYISKTDSVDKQFSRDHLKTLATFYKVPEKELITLWVAHKITRLVDKEKIGKEAIVLALKEIENK